MLKALELAGFKSFADRTRFDFPDGITVVVGPNGSGKSNIVDGIKWVLGSQSAKSLRGKDMSDVIFKGSQSRKAAASAEATIVFDNAAGTLPVDAPEVHVTRRVFRSGEGEYLINGEPCRLKDVKNLVRGTGIGIDAYSLIEQGKVDRMLNASAKDRRAIFEEAAGISRFKAKKVEAARRLARVDQNLVRLGDIVDEVAARLKSIKSQATKAERYRIQSTRLKELRMQVAWTDWQEFSNCLEQTDSELAEAEATREAVQAELAGVSESRQQLEMSLQAVAMKAQSVESSRTEASRRIASLVGRRDADTTARQDIEQSSASQRRRLQVLQAQAGTATAELRRLESRLADAVEMGAKAKAIAEAAEAENTRVGQHVDHVRRSSLEAEQQHLNALREASELDGQMQRLNQQISEAQRSEKVLEQRISAQQAVVKRLTDDAERCQKVVADLDTQIEAYAVQIDTMENELADRRRVLNRRREEIAALQSRLHGVSERLNVLEDLQQRHEGVENGVRDVLDAAARDDSGPLASCHGIVADLFEADVHVAPLIDVALGGKSQFLVVSGDEIQRAVAAGAVKLSGRVGLIRMDELPSVRPGERIRLDGLAGIIGRADRMVKAGEKIEPLVRHLLCTTWLVESLEIALGLSRLSGAGLRFVTRNCELLERDGSVVIGPARAAAGLVSRRSELASARKEQQTYRYQLEESDKEASRLAANVEQRDAELHQIITKHRDAVTQRAASGATLTAATDALDAQVHALRSLTEEAESIHRTHNESQVELVEVRQALAGCRQRAERYENQQEEFKQTLQLAQDEERQASDALMKANVELARSEQRSEALETAIEQVRRDQGERREAVDEVRQRLNTELQRLQDLDRRMLDASSELNELYLSEQADGDALKALAAEVSRVRVDISAKQKEIDAVQKRVNKAAEQVHAIQRRRDTADVQRANLAQRLLDDYEINLAEVPIPEDFEPPEDRQAVEKEITDLRQQVQKSGSVNMEALEELEELQERYDMLHGQYQDLTAAKASLERIVNKINADSRRLFLDTLEAIRTNFQTLYRRSFGGGSADLILEEGADPLEAGVEIIATPPGKPTFSNTLLSGGEKALTAVALLMSIFKYRPSPFCVLDEVDAPFDEANIGRFVSVLQEFLEHSKFVVVTHSKKTMTAAHTLYGVTMQESGVSTRVSVRFEDVSEDGHISEEAVKRSKNDEAA
ncbi:Chromosome partition protein Smc [Rosistilla oblonga]|uniref:Chromosome partition protein Smc n=1 Tax=Rosistilla oblonga TaxID=2527990 RepID=A0A518IX12_9BACT|nr:chromosome segregation protein SMC [Rosistilla oblonga]QDV14191.1 Chromosome partition protein Smc [Rosistilla oblonga]QDV57624.1 Chromosome partition protein Smc [Rosistilla oblonga]